MGIDDGGYGGDWYNGRLELPRRVILGRGWVEMERVGSV